LEPPTFLSIVPQVEIENALATKSQYAISNLGFDNGDFMETNGNKRSESTGTSSVPRIDAGTILSSNREIILVHKQVEYRLRVTSNDKLILTK
jgi:hemin uptake protein HemP